MTSDFILDVLEEFYSQPVLPRSRRGRARPSPWAFLREVRMGTGKVRRSRTKGQPRSIRQRMDAWVYNTWPSAREAIAFEVKCSIADYRSEIRNPRKREAAMAVSNRFYFITGGFTVDLDSIPADCGHLAVSEDGTMILVKEAPWRSLGDFPGHFVNALIRRIAQVS